MKYKTKIFLNGKEIPGITNLQIDFGIAVPPQSTTLTINPPSASVLFECPEEKYEETLRMFINYNKRWYRKLWELPCRLWAWLMERMT